MKPLIGIPTRTIKDLDAFPSYGIRATFTRALELAGGAPVLIPLQLSEESLRAIFARVDGLFLAGGIDVHPREFGENVEPFCGEIDTDRDAAEMNLTRWALDQDTPVFGICRGIQSLNIAAGGSLYQDIAAQVPAALPHPHRKGNPYNLRAHAIEIARDSRLARALGATRLEVNSLHHQALKQIAPGFRVSARAPDGIVEGIEAAQKKFAVGVQFHPEWMLDDDARMLKLFQEFVAACDRGSAP
ncbi:MAG: gamma-glutamyl-gamma-aminobutyrate hydrolase family protein [Chloroflexi bacterium]|nr:gamma-glutamyl-gamma-aminobutyrate hydrolase family protein [Chloroflexota bacterium]